MSNPSSDPEPTALPGHSAAGTETTAQIFGAPEIEREIGPYHLLELIGEGGMGMVYKADQRQPIKRTVAVKLIKLGMDSRQVIARFESERQALAMMNHPNVARVLDAGTTPSGRPYFVMEYVPGEPITSFCDRNHFTTRQRLELFCQACHAVQHAHQKAIIHRDLKPSNVLVSFQDGVPTVKVIDFGVAKATAHRLTDMTLFTETGALVGTREYMSPEQADPGALDIDTRTDVYSLGVILYELLAGALPFDSKSLRIAGYAEMQRIIREVEPPRPSTRLSKLGPEASEIAANRRTQLDQLERELKRELEWIPLKAMRKERGNRYVTPIELSQDVQNYLEQKPLLAAPESAAYRLRKFIRRNKGPVIAVAAVVIVLVAGIVGTTIGLVGQARQRAIADRKTTEAQQQEQRANQQAARADEEARNAKAEATKLLLVNRFLESMLSAATPDRMLGDRVTVVQVMQEAVKKLDAGSLKENPSIEARLRVIIGNALYALGRDDDAARVLEQALEIDRKALPPGDKDMLDNLNSLGVVLDAKGRLDDAIALYREALDICRRALPPQHATTAITLGNLATALASRGQYAEAEPLARESHSINKALFRPDHASVLRSTNNLAHVLSEQEKFDEAEQLYREALTLTLKNWPAGHPNVALRKNNLAEFLRARGKLDEAEPLLREALEIWRATLPAGHVQIAMGVNNLAGLLKDQKRYAESETLSREALVLLRSALPRGHASIAQCVNNLAVVLVDQGRRDEAEALLRESLEECRKALPPNHPIIRGLLINLGMVLQLSGKLAEAEPLFQDVLRIERQNFGPRAGPTTRTAAHLSEVLKALGRDDESATLRSEYDLPISTKQSAPTTTAATQPASAP